MCERELTNDDVAKYDRLICKVARGLRVAGEMNIGSDWFDELHAAGLQGLIEAFRDYDPGRGSKFTSYVFRRARLKMLDCLGDYHRGGRQGKNHCMAVSKARRDLKKQLGHEPTQSEVYREAGKHLRGNLGEQYRVKPETIEAWVSSGVRQDCVVLLSQGQFVDDVARAVPSQLVFRADQADLVEAAHDAGVVVGLASDFCRGRKERGLKWFTAWLLVRVDGLTLEAAGQNLGYTRERVRQVVDIIDVVVRKRLGV